MAKVFLSKKWGVWRVIYCGDVMSEFKTEDMAKAYCAGFNAALVERL